MTTRHDDQPWQNVYAALSASGVGGQTAADVVTEMQNRGILPRMVQDPPPAIFDATPTPERVETIADMLMKTASVSYRDWLTTHGRIAQHGFVDDGTKFTHPAGVELTLLTDRIHIAYPAPWADLEYDRTAWLDLAYGTPFEVLVDVVNALVLKVEDDRRWDEDGRAEHDAQREEPF